MHFHHLSYGLGGVFLPLTLIVGVEAVIVDTEPPKVIICKVSERLRRNVALEFGERFAPLSAES